MAGDLTSIIMPVLLPDPYQKFMEMTRYAIQSIQNFTKPDEYELILIEAGKRYDNINLGKNLRPGIDQYISFPNNHPQPASLNLGISKSEGKYICLICNDCFVCPGWLDAVKRCLARGNNFVGAYHHRVPYEEYLKKLEDYNSGNYAVGGSNFSTIAFSCTLFTREDYEKVGPFDEKLTFNKWDVDYSWRIAEADMVCDSAIDAPVTHRRAATYWGSKLPPSIDNYWVGPLAHAEGRYFKEKWGDK
jgi:GT2 family glycosyltransferase